MTTDHHADVGYFHSKFDLDNTLDQAPGPRPFDLELMKFRLKFLKEELQEFEEGLEAMDIVEMADALVDLEYVVHGTAHLLGLPYEELWDDVQRANMTKQRAAADGSDSKRGSSFDVVKPPGWVGPNTAEILAKHGIWKEVSE